MDIRQKIAHNKMTSFQWLVVGLTVLLNMLDGFDLMALAFTAKSIREELQLDGAAIGSLMSAGLFGMAIGSLFLSPLADKFGRRPLLLIGTGLATLGMLLTYFATSAFEIGVWRVLTGLGVAAILTGTNVLVSEYSSQKWRGFPQHGRRHRHRCRAFRLNCFPNSCRYFIRRRLEKERALFRCSSRLINCCFHGTFFKTEKIRATP
ncbi:MFS transporter [Mannheimia haemolytica]